MELLTTEERHGTIRGTVEGPRWAKFPQFLRDRCFILGVELEMEIDKGWIRENVRFKIEGNESKVRRIMREIKESIEVYNRA